MILRWENLLLTFSRWIVSFPLVLATGHHVYIVYVYQGDCVLCFFIYRIVSSVRKEITDYYFLQTELQSIHFSALFRWIWNASRQRMLVRDILRNYMRVKRERERRDWCAIYQKDYKNGGTFYTIRYLEMVVQCVLVNVLYKIRWLNYIS